jgi:hypothetical protein
MPFPTVLACLRSRVARLSSAAAGLALVSACGTSDVPAPVEEFEPAIIGAACSDPVACEPVAQCLDFLPNGFCSVACDQATACPGDTLCRAFGDAAWCVPSCRDDLDCRNGYRCEGIAADDGTTYQVCSAPVTGR